MKYQLFTAVRFVAELTSARISILPSGPWARHSRTTECSLAKTLESIIHEESTQVLRQMQAVLKTNFAASAKIVFRT